MARRCRIAARPSDSTGWPSKSTEPEVTERGGSSRMIVRAVIDLPDPDSPTRPTASPGPIANVASWMTVRRSPRTDRRTRSWSTLSRRWLVTPGLT